MASSSTSSLTLQLTYNDNNCKTPTKKCCGGTILVLSCRSGAGRGGDGGGGRADYYSLK